MTYQEALDFLYQRLPMYQRVGAVAFKKDLSNTIALSELVDNPHRSFKSVHIAGTNGKGSSAHALASILQEAGYRTGLYTSPHLHSYRERIRINGQMIEEDFVADFVGKHQDAILEIAPSFFEITVVMAFAYFAQKQVDIAVIETGLGGRLDSTNIITPEVSLITTISKDHENLLGNTLEAIAKEKAGIIKSQVPVVLGNIAESPKQVIVEYARTMEAGVVDNYANWKATISGDEAGTFDLYCKGKQIHQNIHIPLKGGYFLQNLPPVLDVVRVLGDRGFTISDENIKNGVANLISNTNLKGRWQQLTEKPLTICDIGHNVDGITQLMNQIRATSYRNLHIVFGTVSDKSIEDIISLLIKEATYYFCAADVPRAMPASHLQQVALEHGLAGEVYDSVNQAIKQAQKNAHPDDLIFIGGSTFVVAEIENL